MKTFLTLAFFIFSITASAQDQPVRGEDFVRAPAIGDGLSVSNVFQSNMVVQRDKPLTVWGWAGAGEKVTVSLAGKTGEAVAGKDRAWKVVLEALPADNSPQVMKIQGAKDTLKLENILVGDVWVLGGQSNMEFDIVKVDDGELEAASANFPKIRLLSVPRGKGFGSVASFERLEEWSSWSSRHFTKGDWLVCSPETVRDFSAIGYVFGRRLHMASQVPIGLVDVSVGGTTVETWTPKDVFDVVEGKETRDVVKQWEEKIDAWDPQADLEKRVGQHQRRLESMEKQGKTISDKDRVTPSDLRPGPVEDRNRPGYCYASMIRPLEGLSVKGAIFHQGFNNCFSGSDGARMYYQVFGKMVTSWRKAFGDEQLPFCILSLCTAGNPQTEDNFLVPMYDVGPLIREAQHKTYRDFRDGGDEAVGFASTFDFRKSWYHPQIKVPAGERAAKWALVTQYGILGGKGSEDYWLPPSIKEVETEGGGIRLHFSTELRTADESTDNMVGFAIAGEDRRFYPAQVEYFQTGVDSRKRPQFKKSILVLKSPHVRQPLHYRYAWARNPMANITNRYGIPIPTQRSDDWVLEEMVPGLEAPEGMDENGKRRWLGGQVRKALGDADLERRYQDAQAKVDALRPEIEKLSKD